MVEIVARNPAVGIEKQCSDCHDGRARRCGLPKPEGAQRDEDGRRTQTLPTYTYKRLAGVRGECESSAKGCGFSKCADATFRGRDWKISSRSMRQTPPWAAEKRADVFPPW